MGNGFVRGRWPLSDDLAIGLRAGRGRARPTLQHRAVALHAAAERRPRDAAHALLGEAQKFKGRFMKLRRCLNIQCLSNLKVVEV